MKANVITLYLPVFRERLERLERRGKGRSVEAEDLRRTIRRVEEAVPEAAEGAAQAA